VQQRVAQDHYSQNKDAFFVIEYNRVNNVFHSFSIIKRVGITLISICVLAIALLPVGSLSLTVIALGLWLQAVIILAFDLSAEHNTLGYLRWRDGHIGIIHC
jgi:cellulose synthase/poly-beta-1,6-N-acetylglucosamine synthase-like glycosyltransferase